jgi:type I restriction enzyme, S subunit
VTVPLGRLVDINPPTPEFDEVPDNEPITFMPLETVWPDGRADTTRRILKADAGGYTRFQSGDVLLPKITPTFEAGRVVSVSIDTSVGAATTEVHVLRPHPGVDARYIAYVGRSQPLLQEGATTLQGVGNLRRVPIEYLKYYAVAHADSSEQRRIADFLDRETAQIDVLIAKQEQLIRGLLERRESLAGHTVFSGLRGGELRDNDEAWLPPTPATWPVTQLGFVTDTLAGYAFPSEGFTSNPSDAPLLRGINVKPGVIDWSEVVYWDENLNPVPFRYRLEPGDLVLGMDRPFIGAGIRVASISEDDASSLLLQRVMRIRPLVNSDRSYLHHLFSTRSFYMYLEPMFTGVSVPHISEWQVRKYRIPLPPIDAQREIARYLDRKTAKIDALIAKAEEFIGVARERRAALITEAVTGGIDVSTGKAREGA